MLDYFKLRVELNLAQFPDDMVSETGHEVEGKILCGLVVTPTEIAWLIEAAERAAPRVVTACVSDGMRATEMVG